MALDALRSSLLLQFQQPQSSASELIESFNKSLSDDEIKEDVKKKLKDFLIMATDHKRADLATHLLIDVRCNRDIALDGLFIAINSVDVELVEVFLRSRFHLKLLKKSFLFPTNDMKNMLEKKVSIFETKPDNTLSAIECACISGHLGILKLLVEYDKEQVRCQSHLASGYFSWFPTNEKHFSPLQAVINLLRNEYFRKMLTLPGIVQLVVDSGTGVNDVRDQYLRATTAVNLLIFQVRDLGDTLIDETYDVQQMIVETLRVLLTAGAHAIDPKSNNTLYLLMRQSVRCSSLIVQQFASADKYNNYNRMILALLKLLLQHGALQLNVDEKRHFFRILLDTPLCGNEYTLRTDQAHSEEMYRMSINCVAEVFHYCSLADPDVTNNFYSPNTKDTVSNWRSTWFKEVIMCIARYSSLSGFSDKYISLLLNCMSASHIIHLKTELSKVHHNKRDQEDKERALELISAVEVPFSLQHLSRRVITRAMSYRCLNEEKMATLNLPKCIQEYVLRHVD